MDKKEIYRGKARIMNIGAEDLPDYAKTKLPERDRETAFMLVYDVETLEATPRRFDVKEEISHRELSGKALEWNKREDGRTPTQIDIAIKDLIRQGLLAKGATEADLGSAMADALLGREVFINVTQDANPNRPGEFYPERARFISAFARATGSAAASRMAAFISGKPYTPPQPTAPAPVPAPEDSVDPDDLPF